MTPQDKVKFLSEYKDVMRGLQVEEQSTDTYLELLISNAQFAEKQGLKNADYMQATVEEYQRKKAKERARAKEYIKACEVAIQQVPNERQRKLLTLRYLEGLRWEDVAERMTYSVSQIHRIHRAAITAVRL